MKRLLLSVALFIAPLLIPSTPIPYTIKVFIAMNFDVAFTKLLGHEGGYVNHPSDPGGETNWGITARVARDNGYRGPMKDLPVETAKAIYKKLYWDAVKAEQLPPVLRYATFDAAVNSGVGTSIKWLQRAAGVTADGVIGPKTLAAVNSLDAYSILMRMVGYRLNFMSSLSHWPAFGRGWARRISDLLTEG